MTTKQTEKLVNELCDIANRVTDAIMKHVNLKSDDPFEELRSIVRNIQYDDFDEYGPLRAEIVDNSSYHDMLCVYFYVNSHDSGTTCMGALGCFREEFCIFQGYEPGLGEFTIDFGKSYKGEAGDGVIKLKTKRGARIDVDVEEKIIKSSISGLKNLLKNLKKL